MKYQHVLNTSLRECNSKGQHLKLVKREDIMEWRIKEFQHKILSQYYIEELINSDKNAEALILS